MKRLLTFILILTSLAGFGQGTPTTQRADRIIANQTFYLRDWYVDTVQRDTVFIGRVRSIPTSDAVSRYVAARLAGLPKDSGFVRLNPLYTQPGGFSIGGDGFIGGALRLGGPVKLAILSTAPIGANGYVYYDGINHQISGFRNGVYRNFLMSGDATAPTSGSNHYIQNQTGGVQSAGFRINQQGIIENRLWVKSASPNSYTANITIGDGFFNGLNMWVNNVGSAGYGHYGQTWAYALNADMRVHPSSSIKTTYGTRIIQANGSIGGSHFSHYTQMQGGSSGVGGSGRFGYYADIQNDIVSGGSNSAYGLYVIAQDNYQTQWQYRTNLYGTYVRMPSTQGATYHMAKQGHYISVGNKNGNGYAIYADSGMVFVREVPNSASNTGQFLVRDGGVIKYLSTAQMKTYLGAVDTTSLVNVYDFDVTEFNNDNKHISIKTIDAGKITQTDSLQLVGSSDKMAWNNSALFGIKSYSIASGQDSSYTLQKTDYFRQLETISINWNLVEILPPANECQGKELVFLNRNTNSSFYYVWSEPVMKLDGTTVTEIPALATSRLVSNGGTWLLQ